MCVCILGCMYGVCVCVLPKNGEGIVYVWGYNGYFNELLPLLLSLLQMRTRYQTREKWQIVLINSYYLSALPSISWVTIVKPIKQYLVILLIVLNVHYIKIVQFAGISNVK